MNKIMENLQNKLNYVYSLGYNPDQILGIFLYGSQNYGTSTKDSDIDAKVILIPSFKDLCCKKEWYSKEIIQSNGEHIVIKDIRDYVANVKKQNINFIEILFTEYYILNEKYKYIWNKYFINYRETIARYDEQRAVTSILGQARHTLSQSHEGKDSKKLYNVMRLCDFLERYTNDVPYVQCLKPLQREELLRIKSGVSEYEGYKIYLNLNDKLDKLEKVQCQSAKAAVGQLLDNSVMKIIEFYISYF